MYATAAWNLQKTAKFKQHPKAELLLFKIIDIIHQSYHPKIVGSILKMYRKQVQLFKRSYMINENERQTFRKRFEYPSTIFCIFLGTLTISLLLSS